MDLGCGYGWHCVYAAEQGAAKVVGVDLSEKMLSVAKQQTNFSTVTYQQGNIATVEFAENSFDIVLSSLALHYLPSLDQLFSNVSRYLKNEGSFIFSVEHPLFTAAGSQDWCYDQHGEINHFPVDHYFYEGERTATFLETQITKYHRTLTTYVDSLLTQGFQLKRLIEPMMLIVSAVNRK